MTNERKIQLGTAVDPTGAQQGLQAIEQAGAKTAAALGQSATAAGKAVDGIGDGGERAAKKLQAAERGIVASIQRATAAAQAGERGTASFYESLARGRGIDPGTLRPYLEQLRAAEQASRSAAAGVGQIGVSAAQTAAALRGVPAQFTDIAVSIASGQQPLTVLLQQGGQLKDMFGGVGAAARALGGFVVGLINPFTVAAAGAAALAYAYKLGSDEASAYSRAIILSGQAAGVTAGQLQAMASGVAALGSGTQGRAAEILAQLASSADVGASNMQRFTAAALAFEKVGGGAAEETAKAFQALADKPLAAALKLNESTNFLTQRTYEQIKALQEQGRTTDAARVAQEAYATAVETRTPQLVGSLGFVERAWLSIKTATKGAFDAALNVGRGNTLDGQIGALRERIESAQSGIYSRDKVPALRQELALLQEQQRMLQRGAEAAAAQSVALRATADFDKQALEYRKDGKRLAEEILQIRQRGVAAGKSEAEVVALIAAVVERTAKTSAAPVGTPKLASYRAEEAAARSYMQALEALAGIQQQAGAASEGLTKTQAKLRDVQADPAWATYSRQQQEQIITQAASAQAAEDQAAAVKAGAKVAAEASRDYAQWIETLGRGGSAVAAQVSAMQDEAQAAAIAATGRMSLKEAIEEVIIARLREQQVAAMGNPDAVLVIQREIDAREKLRGLIGQSEQRKTSDEAAKAAADEWARTADKIEQSLTDALMNGGKNGAEYIEGLFRSMVLRPVINAIVSPVAGAISGALGLGTAASAASAATGAAGLGSMSGILGLGGIGAGLGTFGTGIASGLSAWGAGGSVTGLLGTGVGGVFSGGIASGLGTLAGALGPIALGAAAISALAKSLDKGGTPSYGSIYTIGTDGRNGGMLTPQNAGGYQLGTVYSAAGSTSQAVQDTVRQFTMGLAATVGAAFSTFGMRPGTVRAGFAADNDDPSIGRLTIRDANGRLLTDQTQRYAANSAKGFEQFSADAGKALRDALVAADLPSWVDGLLTDLGSTPTIEAVQQMVQSVAQLRAVFEQFGSTMGLTEGEIVGLAKTFGGVGELATGLSGYLSAVYSDSERLTLAQQSLSTAFSQLGQSLPANAAAYRALVDAQDLSTDAGRATYAAMLKLAPAFAEVTAAAQTAADEQARIAEQVASQRSGLETELLRLNGSTNELRARELAALDPANRALQERIYALQDAQAAEQAAATAAADRARLADEIAAQADSLDARLMQLIGDAAGLRARELAALDPANRALQERIYALEDAQAAEEAAAASAQQVAAQGESLMTRLLQLQGDTATLRARELAALEPANRALQERIFALEDAQAAAQAARDLAAQWQGVSQTLEEEIARISGLNRTQTANLAQVQADFAVSTAQARAGDQAAAERLPELSRMLLDMSRSSARSAVELSAVQASVVASLTQTASVVRGLAAGPLSSAQDAVQSLMPDTIAAQLVSADQAKTANSTAGQADMLAELRAMRTELVDLRAEARATAGHAAAISRLHQRWDGNGLLVRNDSDTPLTTTVI